MYSTHCFLVSCLGLALSSLVFTHGVSQAQTSTITADPEAEALRTIWQVTGGLAGGDEVGQDAVGLGDLFGTGRGVWGVYYGKLLQWKLFRHDSDTIAKDTVAFKTIKNSGSIWVGEFWGKGEKGVVMYTGSSDTTGGETKYFQELHAFHVSADTISDSIATMMNSRTMTPRTRMSISKYGVMAADLNNDGADELVMAIPGAVTDTGNRYNPEIWIFKGGPDFRLDSPTVIVTDTRRGDGLWWEAATGDFDGDGHTDIFMGGGNSGDFRKPSRMTFYWGNGTLEGYTDIANRRTVELTGELPHSASGVTPLDCDGDGIPDLAIDHRVNPSRGTYIFRSRTGKNARTRSYHRSDADNVLPDVVLHMHGGHLNDSSRRYEMLQMGLIEGQTGYPPHMFFAGGDNGPDQSYDAFAGFGGYPLFDVNGDGWDDFIGINYTVNLRAGIAVIYAGGPYIPSPKVSGVEAIAGEGHSQAITVWPNPLRDDLHIAWRGDLRRIPRSFRVHDLLGREVAHGGVPPGTKAALWRSGDLPGGTYLLSVYAHDGGMITTTHIIKY